MHWMGIVCGAVILLARLLRVRSLTILVAPTALCVMLMIILTVISQVAVSPKMAVLRVQMGSIEASAAGNPWLAEFARLHAISVGLESGVLLAGMAALFLMVKDAAVR
jgi:hypothetical protein